MVIHRRSKHWLGYQIKLAIIGLAILFLVAIGLSWFLPDSHSHRRHHRRVFRGKHRLAVVLPFVGSGPEAIPAYLDVFCVGAAAASQVADFLLIHNGVLESYDSKECPTNVIFINLRSSEHFAEYLLRVVDGRGELAMPADRLLTVVAKHITIYPYALVEFKPALGYIFADHLEGYSHWAYADVDMLFGDLGRWIEPGELTDFDIVTYGFGDQERVYLRGQFTFHRNTPEISRLWTRCEYLSHLDERLAAVMDGDAKYHFESAEGCYSAAVLEVDNIRIKYAVKAWTDIDEGDTVYSHGLHIARDVKRGKAVLYKAVDGASGRDLLDLPSKWFEKDAVYKTAKLPLQQAVGEMTEVQLPHDAEAKCMYWVQPKYQRRLCLEKGSVSSTNTLYWINGRLFRQEYENTALSTNVITGPFFHFQEWKRYYRSSQLATLHLSSPVSDFVLTKSGAIPMVDASHRHGSYIKALPSPLQLKLKHWKDDDRTLLPSRPVCLLSGPKRYPVKPVTAECLVQTSWQDQSQVEILSGSPAWNTVDMEKDITLVLTLQLTAGQARNAQALSDILELVVQNLLRWQGRPCVIVIHVAGATEESVTFLQHRLGPNSDVFTGIDNALIGAIFHESEDAVSRKALLSMAASAVPTRWYVTGIEIERGLILSSDALYFAVRAAKARGTNGGNVLVIPQFALKSVEHPSGAALTLSELAKAKSDGLLQPVAELDDACNDEEAVQMDTVDSLWWGQVGPMMNPGLSMETVERRAELLQSMELQFLSFLTNDHHLEMFAMDESPILLMDNKGPHLGTRTNELVAEVEELGGRRCYNGLRLAQMAALGYNFDVLGGAFAVSTEASRRAPMLGLDETQPGTTRCDGCFMFGEGHEEILEDIIRDEIHRAAKTSVLWTEAYDSVPK